MNFCPRGAGCCTVVIFACRSVQHLCFCRVPTGPYRVYLGLYSDASCCSVSFVRGSCPSVSLFLLSAFNDAAESFDSCVMCGIYPLCTFALPSSSFSTTGLLPHPAVCSSIFVPSGLFRAACDSELHPASPVFCRSCRWYRMSLCDSFIFSQAVQGLLAACFPCFDSSPGTSPEERERSVSEPQPGRLFSLLVLPGFRLDSSSSF